MSHGTVEYKPAPVSGARVEVGEGEVVGLFVSSDGYALEGPTSAVIVLRDAPRGLEVLLLKRAEKPGDQNSGASVFPGGLLDKADAGHHELCTGLTDAEASARLGVPSGGLDYWIAAVRECFEEAGLLFATEATTRPSCTPCATPCTPTRPAWPSSVPSSVCAWRWTSWLTSVTG